MLAGGGALPDEVLGDHDDVAVAHAEDALVEELVVQGAQAQSVVDDVRAVEGPPPYVRGLQPDGGRPDAPVVAAERALVLVRGQHQVPHAPVPPLPRPGHERVGLRGFQFQAHRLAQVGVEGRREVQVEQDAGHPAEERGLAPQRGAQLRYEPSGRARRAQLQHAGAGAAGAAVRTDLPHPVADEVVEGVGGRGPVGGAVLDQEPFQVLLHRAVAQFAVGVLLEAGERVEQQQRFVGRPYAVSRPLPQLRGALQPVHGGRSYGRCGRGGGRGRAGERCVKHWPAVVGSVWGRAAWTGR